MVLGIGVSVLHHEMEAMFPDGGATSQKDRRTRLWRWAGPEGCRVSWQVGDPGEPMSSSSPKSKGLRTGRADGVLLVRRPAA